jgi:hypothetical protein
VQRRRERESVVAAKLLGTAWARPGQGGGESRWGRHGLGWCRCGLTARDGWAGHGVASRWRRGQGCCLLLNSGDFGVDLKWLSDV